MTLTNSTPDFETAVNLLGGDGDATESRERGAYVTLAQRRAAAHDFQAAYRALLDGFAVLASDDPTVFRTIRARQKEMRTWFYDMVGWWLIVTGDCAYLAKHPVAVLPWHGFDTDRDRPLQQALDYELLVWALWYGERKPLDHTFLIGMLASEIAEETRPYVGTGHIDWNHRAHRESLVRAMRVLEHLGAVRRLDGEAEWFERDGVDADTVYEFTPVARLMRTQPAAELLPDGVTIGTAAQERPVTVQQRLYRALLTLPAVLAEFEPEGFALLQRNDKRMSIAADIEDHVGWQLEVTTSYAALMRQREAGAQPSFPTGHIITRITLLLCQHLRAVVAGKARGVASLTPDGFDRVIISRERFQSELGRVKQKYDKWWGATTRARGLGSLAEDVLDCMRGWGLALGPAADDQITIYPTAARFGAVYTDDEGGLTDDGDDL
jgi:uncharacterized protein (TIGR02678 family)